MNSEWYDADSEEDYLRIVKEFQKKALASLSSPKLIKSKTKVAKVAEYFPPEIFKPFMEEVVDRLSDDECRRVLHLVFTELSKEANKDGFSLSPAAETAIIQFMIENQ